MSVAARHALRLAVVLACAATGPVWAQTIEQPSPALSVVDSPCFSPYLGGYLHQRTLDDGRWRLTARAGAIVGGMSWTIELLVSPAEVRSIWADAVATTVAAPDAQALLALCRADNMALKSARDKEAFNAGQRLLLEPLARSIQPVLSSVPADVKLPLQVLTAEEQAALAALKADPAAQRALDALHGDTRRRVQAAFAELSNTRARHLPTFRAEDHRREPARAATGISK